MDDFAVHRCNNQQFLQQIVLPPLISERFRENNVLQYVVRSINKYAETVL